MASISMLVGGGGGAVVNALAFNWSNKESKRHDKAIEELQAAQAAWSQKRTECIDFINEDPRRQGHAVQTFKDVDDAMRQYARVIGP